MPVKAPMTSARNRPYPCQCQNRADGRVVLARHLTYRLPPSQATTRTATAMSVTTVSTARS
jgi:hypothetical protein